VGAEQYVQMAPKFFVAAAGVVEKNVSGAVVALLDGGQKDIAGF
jgi:hypothetical protein